VIDKAHALLDGWEPVTPLEDGLQRTIAYFRSILGIGNVGRTVISVQAYAAGANLTSLA
jgi:hypothetical protein